MTDYGYGDWEVKLETDWATDYVDIYIFRRTGERVSNVVHFDLGGLFRIEQVDPGESLKGKETLRIPGAMLRALVEAARGKFVPSEQMHEHLKDAIVVRDRLLTLIEQKG